MNTLRRVLTVPSRSIHRQLPKATFRHMGIAALFISLLGLSLSHFTQSAISAASCNTGKVMNVVAHQDDDILFLSPDLLDTISGGGCVRTIYVTAGDDGRTADYWSKREEGARAAYAVMAGTTNHWTNSVVQTGTSSIHISTLTDDPRISLLFMRLPDGDHNGAGFKLNSRQSLQRLWDGAIPDIQSVDKVNTYTKDELIATLADLMRSYRPSTVNTQDYAGAYGDGDHSDHHTVAYITKLAQDQYGQPHNFVGYEDYTTSNKPANVLSDAYTRKQAAFFAYAEFDPHVCDTEAVCSHLGYGAWLPRQYTVPLTIKQPLLSGIVLNNAHMASGNVYAQLQGGKLDGRVATAGANHIGLAGVSANTATTAQPKQKASTKGTAPTLFHMPFVGLDVPQLSAARLPDVMDISTTPQPAVIVRAWTSDSELSEIITSTV